MGDRDGRRERHSGNGVYFFRTSAAVLARTVAEVAADVWRAESLKYPETASGPARLGELRSDYAALADVLLEVGLEDVEVLLGELGGPGDEPTDVTLAGRHPETGEFSYVCIELCGWPLVASDPYEPRLVQFGGSGEGVHPLERVRARRACLISTNAALGDHPASVDLAAYLHAATVGTMTESPDDRLFLGDLRTRFMAFLKSRFAPRFEREAADTLLSGARRPPRPVLEAVADAMPTPPFHPLGRQMLAVGRAMAAIRAQEKQVVVVTGAAGTGKTALAVQLIAEVLQFGANAVCLSGPVLFRQSLEAALKDTRRRKSTVVIEAPEHFETSATTNSAKRKKPALLVFDDAQGMRTTSTARYGRRADGRQIEELLDAADVSVFLIDRESVLKTTETGTVDLILEAAGARGVPVEVVALNTPIRFGGSVAYARWVSALLGPDGDALPWIPDDRHNVLTADSPDELETFLRERHEQGFIVRMTAGTCWHLARVDAHDPGVRVGEWRRPWQHLTYAAETERVGTPGQVQGFEFDWCGVIVGPDLVHRDGRWITDREANVDRGLMSRSVPDDEADRLIRNAYRVLLTRGATGVVLFSPDPETQETLRRLVPGRVADQM